VTERASIPSFPVIVRTFADIDVPHMARCIGFVAAILVIWVSLRPFVDLADPAFTDLDKGKLASTYVALGLFSIAALALTMRRHAKALRSLMTPTLMILCCWMCVNVVFSHDIGLSVQRLILSFCVIALAASLLLLPESKAELDRLFAASVLIFLVLSYLGVLLAPSLSMHTARDTFEPQLAGGWRGTFGHKNVAAPIMAMLVFVGIYLVARRAMVSGAAIVNLAGFFLIMTGGKSAMALCALTLILGAFVVSAKSFFLRVVLSFLPLLCLNLLTVGSIFSERLSAIVKLLPFDATFTGRTEIWEFAISSLGLRPWLGYGFAAFWGTQSIQNLVQDDRIEWTAAAAHSHNGYLDNALTMGIPGLALVIAIFVVEPLRNFSVATASSGDEPLARLFMRIWLFGIYLSSMESFLLDRADPIWFTFLVGVFGLHYLARFRLR
jgi:O-antigen ligase